MPLTFAEDTILIDGVCGVEDAMPLLEFLQTHGVARIDLGACTHLHSAPLQVLLAVAERVTALPEEEFLRRWLTSGTGITRAWNKCRDRDMIDSRQLAELTADRRKPLAERCGPMRERLRLATRDIHESLHRHPGFADLMAGTLSMSGYIALLERLVRFPFAA